MRRNLLVFICAICFTSFASKQAFIPNAWINEIHYDNLGTDVNEGVEIVIENADSLDLSKFEIILYNGNGGVVYNTSTLEGITPATSGNFKIFWKGYPSNGIQNGAPDGIAIAYRGVLIQFLSYEGKFTATNGVALGVESIDIIVLQAGSDAIGLTLQLSGAGSAYGNFTWQQPATGTPGQLNTGQTLGVAANLNPIISEISYSPVNPITSATDVVVSAKVVDPEGVLRTVNLNWGYASDGISNTITMVKGENDIFSATIPAQPDDSTIFFKLYASDNDNGEAFSGVDSYTVFDPKTAVLPYLQTFDANLGDFYSYSASGDTKKWGFSNGYALMNGFNSGELERDFLISPSFDFTTTLNEVISFKTWRKFGTEDNSDKYLKLMYSTNYAGVGDATAATWTEVPGVTMASANEVWTKTEDVDVSMISGTNVRFAFVYNYATDYVLWEVDSIQITGIPNTSALNQHQNNGLRIIQSSNNIHVVSNLGFDIQLYSVTGTLLFQQTNINKSIDINNLSRGIYIVKAIHNDNNTVVKKIIVNN
jgi:hypothetical protein